MMSIMAKRKQTKPKQRNGRPYALQDGDLSEILQMLVQGTSLKRIADQYHVSRCAVRALLGRHGKKYVTTVAREVVSECLPGSRG